jgi:hypothetical protein
VTDQNPSPSEPSPSPVPGAAPAAPVSSPTPILARAVKIGLVFAVVLAVVGAVVGYLVDGSTGLTSALIGAGMTAVFLSLTALSIILANKVDMIWYFGVILGAWLIKFVVFLVLSFLLKDQPWINTLVMFLTVIVGMIGSVVIDVLVVVRSRMPYVDAALPASASDRRGE